MRLKRITITNFKGFSSKVVEFHDRMTVVIGNNTAGKTTLLKAIQVGLGAYLQSLNQLPGGAQYRRNFSAQDTYKYFDEAQHDYLKNPERPSIKMETDFFLSSRTTEGDLVFETLPVNWCRTSMGNYTSHTKACAGELINAVAKMEKRRKEMITGGVYPLLLSFGAHRTQNGKISTKVKERVSRVEKAYRFCLHDQVDFVGTIEWLNRYEKDLRDKKNFEGNKEAFFKALTTAIPALSEVDFDGEIEALVTVTGHNPERHHFSYMSDGLQAMINIVSEIAHRCIELNGCLGQDAVTKTPGIVMIDEVDLYLHPHWQKHVLQDLMKAFPKIQFIVSTHSPFIIQSLEENQLLSFDENVSTEGAPFRESLEDITENRMGLQQKLRSEKFQRMVQLATDLFVAADSQASNKEELQNQLTEIEAEFSEDPAYLALIRAEYKSKVNNHETS